MLTFSRAGRTSFFIEDPIQSGNFGGLGFLLPDGTQHIPKQMTLQEAWHWQNSTLGSGWFIFTPPGTSFPDPIRETLLIDQFVSALRTRLPRGSSSPVSGFAWLTGDPRVPSSISLMRLDVVGTNNSRTNAKTIGSNQSYFYEQFEVLINGNTEIRALSGYTGFEILSPLNRPTIQVRIPVTPFGYRLNSSLTIPFEGPGRGSMQFALEPLPASRFVYGALDLSLCYFLRPATPDGSGPPRVLRYPLVDVQRAEGTFELQANLYPIQRTSSYFSIKPNADGSPKRMTTYFRTTAGYPVHLLPSNNVRFNLRLRPNYDKRINNGNPIYYLSPSGDFEIEADGPLDPDTSLTRILAGFSGTEYIGVKSRNGNGPGDTLTFDPDQNAYAETFGALDVGGSLLLSPDYQTPWVRITGRDGAERFYYAQPPEAPLFQANGIFDGSSFLDFSEMRSGSLTRPAPYSFPMTPVAGVELTSSGVPISTYKSFERDLLVPYRDQLVKRNSATAPASPDRSIRTMLQLGAGTEKRTTPQGLLVDVDVANNRFTKILLGKIFDGEGGFQELAITSPTTDLQQALASPRLFLVISHLENVGDFDSNEISMTGWNFVANVAEDHNASVESIMIIKFADGSTLNELVNDTSQWAEPDKFTKETEVQDRLQTIIKNVRDKAKLAGQGDDNPAADTDSDILLFYRKFLETVIDAPNWSGILIFDVSMGNPNDMPREIRGILPGMVVTKGVTTVGGSTYVAPTNKVDPAFMAHHLQINIAKVKQAANGTLEDIENSSISALVDYTNNNDPITGLAKPKSGAPGEIDVLPVEDLADFSFRVKFMRITFENSRMKIFLSDVTLRFHKLFKELPKIETLPDGTQTVNSIDVSGSLQEIDGIPTYVFRFGCVDPLRNNFIVCAEAGKSGEKAIIHFPDVSPVITSIEATRIDFNMLQIGIDVGNTNIAEFVIAGYMATRELDGRDFFSYDRVGFGKLSMVMNYSTLAESAMNENLAMPEEMGNPFWIFTPNTMKFDTVRGQTRDGSIVNRAPLTIKAIAESVSTFSAADAGVFPIPNLVPMSKALIPYQPASSSQAAAPSPVTYVVSYAVSTSGIGLNVSGGGLMDIYVHTGWKEGTWNESGENVFYTAIQWGTPLTGLDIGKQGMFKAELADFGFGEVPTATDERIFFIYVNSLAITVLKWQAKVSLMLFAPAPADKGFEGAFGDGGANINSWFGSFSLTKGSSGTSAISSLPVPVTEPIAEGDPEIILASAALDVKIDYNSNRVPSHSTIRVHGYVQNIKGVPQNAITITVRARLYQDGAILAADSSRTKDVTIDAQSLKGSVPFEILFDTQTWPTSDETYTADVRISGNFISSKRAKTIKQTNTVTLRKDEGKPTSGSPIVEIDYVALGRGIRLRRGSAADGDSNTNVRPAPRTVGDALALMQGMLPSGESGPDLYNVLRDIYSPSAGMMVGIDITIMGWLRLAVIANEADEIYGGLLEIKGADELPAFAKKLAGLRIEILYRRLWDDSDLGVYEGTLVLPDVLRYWDVGGFSITVPVISLQIYTDGGFLLDLGFPTGSFASGYDFSRSFAIQGMIGPFPVMGAVGLYLGRLTAEAEYSVPDLEPEFGSWNSVWKFGFAAKLGLGKAYTRGPLSFELSLTAQLVFQGMAAAIDRAQPASDDSALAPADFLMLEASLSLVLLAQGKFEVKVKGFGLSASLMVKASLGVQFRYMTATPIKIQLSVVLQAQLTVTLDLWLFSISIGFSFEFKFQPTFTIANSEHPDWLDHVIGEYPPKTFEKGDNVLTGGRLANPARGLASLGLLAAVNWTAPGALWDASFDSAFKYTDGGGQQDLRVGGKLPISLVFAAPFTVNKAGNLVSVSSFVIPELHARFLHAGILVWATKMVLGNEVNGNTTLDAEDLDDIRATINDQRDEIGYSVLRSFLDANYTFNVLSADAPEAEQVLKPNPAGETAAVVFPMVPDFSIKYGDTTIDFDTQTIKDGTYFQHLDAYLEALLLRAEGYLGDDMADPADTSPAVTQSLAKHVFTSYFELMVDAGVEDAIEQKVPRAEDVSEISTTWTLAEIVRDVIDRTNPSEIRAVSGVSSRLMMGGHQLPGSFTTANGQPPKPVGFQPLYQLTGQQVPVDLGDKPDEGDADDVVWTVTLLDGEDELATASATYSMYDRLAGLPAALDAAIGFGNDEPRIERHAPYLERNLNYPVDERVPVDSGGTGTLDKALMPFSSPLLTRLSDLDDDAKIASNVTKVTYVSEFSDQVDDISTVASNGYEWALIVPFTAGKVMDTLTASSGSSPTFLKDTYKLGGTDELTRGRIAGLMLDLINGDPGITGVDVMHTTEVGGVAGLTPLSNGSRIVKTNLSTISAPRVMRSLAAMSPPAEKYYGDLNTSDIFASMRLLWEASVVNAPGFFLEYDGEDGLPDAAFGTTETADLSIVIRFSNSSGVPAYANALWYNARPEATERFYIESLDDSTKTAVPVGVPGAIAFYAGRDAVANGQNGAVRNSAALFNLLAYRIKDAGSHAGKWSVSEESWSLPYGPLKLDETQLPSSILNSEWTYEILVPWTKFLTGGRTQSPIFSTTGALSPYDLAGGDVELEIAALDTFGNQFSRTASASFKVLYTDPLLSIPQWPEVKSAYHVNAQGQFVLTLDFGASRLADNTEDIVNRARALRAQYEAIWFQLKDPNTSVTLRTTLKANNGELSPEGGSINSSLLGWVEQILSFLNAKVGGSSATAPGTLEIATTAIDGGTRNLQPNNIQKLEVTIEMSRPENLVDADAADKLESIASVVSRLKPDTTLTPNLPEFAEDLPGLAADSLVGFAQLFETAFPELRVAVGDAENGDQTLWAIRMGRGVGDSDTGIRVQVHPTQRSFFANAPLSTRLESCTIADPEDGSKTISFDGVDMDKLGRRFVAVVDDMLSEEKVVKLRRVDADNYASVLRAKETLASGIPNNVLSIFESGYNEDRQASSRELFRQSLLKSLSAAYDIDTVISYDVTVVNSDSISGTPPNLYGRIVSLDEADGKETAFVVGTAKIRLGNDANGNPPKLTFAFSTETDGARAQLPANLAFQVTYVEHEIQTDKPAWAPPSGAYEYRGSTWLKLVIPDNSRNLNDNRLPNDPIRLSPDGQMTNVPIPLREIPTAPVVLRQRGTPEVAEGVSVTLDKAAAWEYEYQIERPRAAQDRIYLHIAFNKKQEGMGLLQAGETLLHALCRFDLMYSRLIGAGNSVDEQTEPTPADLLGLLPYIEDVAAKWGSWVPSVPIQEYTWNNDDWAFYMSETIDNPNSETPSITIELKALPIAVPVGGQNFGTIPEIRVPDPLTNGPQDLLPQPVEDKYEYTFDWSGAVPDNQTRSFVFSNLNVLKTENARGRMWLTRNENLGGDDEKTNERFIYRSGASTFTEPVQPFIDRTVPVDILNSVPAPATQSIAGYLEKLFEEVFRIAIENGYPWPLIKIGCRYGFDPRNVLMPPYNPNPDNQLVVYLPVLEHVPFVPDSTSGLANQIASAIADWEQHHNIPNSPTRTTGFYEFDLSVFSTLNRQDMSTPMLRLRRLWIRRFG